MVVEPLLCYVFRVFLKTCTHGHVIALTPAIAGGEGAYTSFTGSKACNYQYSLSFIRYFTIFATGAYSKLHDRL